MTLAASSMKYKLLIFATALLTLMTPIAASSFGAANISFEQVRWLIYLTVFGR